METSRTRKQSPSFLLSALAIALMALGLAGCESTGGGTSTGGSKSSGNFVPANPEVLRVGITANMPPFIYRQNGELVGLEVDLARQLAADMGREVRFTDMSFEKLIPALQANQIDIVMAGLNFTQERAAIVSMTTPYMRSGQMALVLRKNAADYTLPGLIGNTKNRVGAEAGTTGEYLVESSFPNATLKTYPSAEAGVMGVAKGEVDLLIHDAPTIYWLAGTYQNKGVTPARPVLTEDLMVWAVNRGNPQLLNTVNAQIVAWVDDGTLGEIVSRWISLQ